VTQPVAVEFVEVWKKFSRGERHDSLRDLVSALARRAFTRPSENNLTGEEFWAVQDVSFVVEKGEGLAIIGPNGAGKSTTLKLLTRILRPTKGRCRVQGRVGALIEVAAGFHPDLTGRENVYLQGAIMGMKRLEIARRFDEIVDFAGVSDFIDTPVKRYSSGMNARLGFSIAAHLNPDVLIIDEILSVGDVAFQQRCIERLVAFKREGAAIVFVSHNLQAVANYFDRGLLIDHGQALFLGPAVEAVTQYTSRRREPKGASTAGLRARIAHAELRRPEGSPGDFASDVRPGEELCFHVTFEFFDDRPDTLILSFYVTDATTGMRLYNASAEGLGVRLPPTSGPGVVTLEFRFCAHLLKGAYHVNAAVTNMVSNELIHRLEPAAHLIVREHFSSQGYVDLQVVCRDLTEEVSPANGVGAGREIS
jgi:lipopolysaccharide transport system ATP-binding protein